MRYWRNETFKKCRKSMQINNPAGFDLPENITITCSKATRAAGKFLRIICTYEKREAAILIRNAFPSDRIDGPKTVNSKIAFGSGYVHKVSSLPSYQDLLSPHTKSRAEPRMAERRWATDGPYGGHPSTLYGEEGSLGRRECL